MKSKCTLILLFVLLFGAASFGQSATATLSTVTGIPGDNVSVQLTVTNFTNVSAITMRVKFTNGVLTFINLTNLFPGFTPTVGHTDTTVSIVWSSVVPITIPNNTLCDLNFQYHGTSTVLQFYNCQVSIFGPPPANLPVTYTNGAVTPDLTLPNHAQIGTRQAAYGATVSVPLYYPVFTENAAAITQRIQYDPTKLSYQNITPLGHLVGALGNAVGGVVEISWSNLAGADISTPGDSILLNFTYIGSTPAPLVFTTGCEIRNTAEENIPVTYYNGVVNPAPPSGNALLEDRTRCQGEEFEVPLDFSGFPVNMTAFTLNINYQGAKLAYLGYTLLDPDGSTTVNPSGTTIHIAWTSPAGSDINGMFLKLKFKYIGITPATVAFGAGCSFTSFPTVPVTVTYTNSAVNPTIPIGNDATVGYSEAVSGGEALVPIYFANLPTNIGAVTLYLNIDPAKLVFIDAPTNPFGAYVGSTGTTVGISWSSITPTDVNGTFIVLRFAYNCGTSDCTAPIVFTDGSEIANITEEVLCMDWHNGGVNMRYKVSGILTYDNDSDPLPLAGVTIYLKDGPEPVPPATEPIPNILASTVTDADGYFEIYAANGTYYIYATSTAAWNGVGPADVLNIRYYIAGLPNSLTDDLRKRAADLTQDGIIFTDDVLVLRFRLANVIPNPNYKAPDWMFTNPPVTVSGAENPGNNLKGICSGDVNGSYPLAY